MSLPWLVWGEHPDAVATAPTSDVDGSPAGVLAVVSSRRRPEPDAVRVDPRIVQPDGPAWAISLVWPPEAARPLFDDPAVVEAVRAAYSRTCAFVSTFTADPVRFAGAVTGVAVDLAHGWPGWCDDDPFARLGARRRLLVGPGLFTAAPLTGPGTQRYAGQPWPARGW